MEQNIEKEVETTNIEITVKSGKKIIIGSLYKSPNSNVDKFSTHLTNTIDVIRRGKGGKELILGMDHNMDLLKCHVHNATQKFLDGLTDRDMFPTITRPMRITQISAVLIDSIFVSKNMHKQFDSGIVLSDISDHLPSIVLLRQNKIIDKKPLEFQCRHLTESKISTIKNILNEQDWNGTLNSDDVSVNCERFSNIFENTMNKVAPVKSVKISGRRCYREPWITKGLEGAAKIKLKL